MRRRFFFLYFFFLLLQSQAQHPDTLLRLQNPAHDTVRQAVKKEFERWQDSVAAARIQANVKKNGQSLDEFLKSMEGKEKAGRRQRYVRIVLGVFFLLLAGLGFLRRHRQSRRV